jgi:hypothetical protein
MTTVKWTLCVVILLAIVSAGVGVAFASPWKDIGLGVSASLVASLIFAIVHQSQLERFVIAETGTIILKAIAEGSEQVEQQVEAILVKHVSDVGRRLQQHVPLRFWPANDSPHSQFNSIVDHAFGESTSYRYAGDRALYLCFRLNKLMQKGRIPNNFGIRVLLADPRDHRCLEAASRYRVTGRGKTPKTITEHTEHLKKDIYASIYGLYKLQRFCDITIILVSDIPLFRIEILDRALFVSIMASLQDGTFPDTAYYDETSDYYRYFTRYFENLCSSSRRSTCMLGDLKTDFELSEYLYQLGFNAPLDELAMRLAQYQAGVDN